MAVETQRTYILMVVGVQQTEDRLMAACTWCSGDDLDTGAIHPSQWKTTKRQQMVVRLMAIGAQQVNFGPRAETNSYLKQA